MILTCSITCPIFFLKHKIAHVCLSTRTEIQHPLWRPVVDSVSSGLMGLVRILPAGDDHTGSWLGLTLKRKWRTHVCAEGGVEL